MKYGEVLRKSVHVSAIVIPLGVWFMEPIYWRPLLYLATVLIVAMDLTRLKHDRLKAYVRSMVGRSLRKHEDYELTGASYMVIACLLVAELFPLDVAVVSMGYLIVGDGVAGLIGKSWGRHRLAFGKSWEGTLSALFANLAVGLLVFQRPAPAILGAFLGTVVELLPLPLDDNLAIPLMAGGILWAAIAL
jgi:dolichol kinase